MFLTIFYVYLKKLLEATLTCHPLRESRALGKMKGEPILLRAEEYNLLEEARAKARGKHLGFCSTTLGAREKTLNPKLYYLSQRMTRTFNQGE